MNSYYKRSSHKFCSVCGSEIRTIKEWTDRHDFTTGAEIKHTEARCPNYFWPWRTNHFREEFEGEDMIVPRYP